MSDFLMAKPSFLEGIARIFDFGNTLNEYNESEEPDALAMRMDWLCVGNDLSNAMKEYVEETQFPQQSAISAK